jgi:CheY-like chemotaxis protein
MPAPRVLIVDDELAILTLLSRTLSARGYEVHAACGPHRALEIVEAMPCFDLVVSDVIMPDMCGPELIRRVSRVCPNIAVVMMSGYLAAEVLPKRAAFVAKPFCLAELCSAVSDALEAPVGGTEAVD